MKSTRDQILDAANRLFYSDGVRAVSVDAVAEKAKITKKTLYYHFRSKDDLITAYLELRDQPNLTLFKRWFDDAQGGIADKIAAIFAGLSKSSRHPKWRGCGFLRTVAELANMPGHPAVRVGAAHKKRFEAWLAEEFAAQTPNAALAATLARRIVILMDGSFSTMLTHRDPTYVDEAGHAAREMVEKALPAHPA